METKLYLTNGEKLNWMELEILLDMELNDTQKQIVNDFLNNDELHSNIEGFILMEDSIHFKLFGKENLLNVS